MAPVPAAASAAAGVTPRSASVTPSQAAVGAAMERHFRAAADESKIDYSAAWRDAKVSIRYLNHMSPLMLGIIQRPGTNASMQERKNALQFMVSSTDALAKVMSERLAVSPDAKAYERVELNSMLSHIVGRIWEKSTAENQQSHVDEFVRTVASVFGDEEFLASQQAHAGRMMSKMGYLRVDSPETMQTRLQLAMHQATLRFFEGVTDERLRNAKGVSFAYGQKKAVVVAAMQSDFCDLVRAFLDSTTFGPTLSNDQRTTVMQSWIRQASEIYRSEYVASTQRVMNWFRAGEPISKEEFEKRFARAITTLPDVLNKTRNVTLETLGDLVAVAGFDGVPEPGDGEITTQAPATSQ